MTDRLTVEIGDWRITQTKTFMNRSQWWIYHKDVLICHHTSLRMTEPELRAMLLSRIEEAEHDDRNTGTVLRNSVEH